MQVYYAKFPPQIDRRQILLLHPVLGRCVPKPLTKLTNTLTQTHSLTKSHQSRERRQRRRSQSSRSTESGKRESTSYPSSPHLVVCTHCSENTPESRSSPQRSTDAHPHILASPISAPTDYCTPLLCVCIYCGSRVFEFKSTNETLSLSTDPMCKHELGILNWAWFWQYKKCYFL